MLSSDLCAIGLWAHSRIIRLQCESVIFLLHLSHKSFALVRDMLLPTIPSKQRVGLWYGKLMLFVRPLSHKLEWTGVSLLHSSSPSLHYRHQPHWRSRDRVKHFNRGEGKDKSEGDVTDGRPTGLSKDSASLNGVKGDVKVEWSRRRRALSNWHSKIG